MGRRSVKRRNAVTVLLLFAVLAVAGIMTQVSPDKPPTSEDFREAVRPKLAELREHVKFTQQASEGPIMATISEEERRFDLYGFGQVSCSLSTRYEGYPPQVIGIVIEAQGQENE